MDTLTISLTVPYWLPSQEMVAWWCLSGAGAVFGLAIVGVLLANHEATGWCIGVNSKPPVQLADKAWRKFTLTFLLGHIGLVIIVVGLIILIREQAKDTPEKRVKQREDWIRSL
ncbi:hypothetical protein DFO67_1353 [Modicisalibacter xianhensis]|uniref:Uncharacterized protein n=1 Tax=Modicisalibacter xianhensis TaxID=442341 RepID=A0A4V3GS58_9GAMM|nr:hypothetical protein [Halomonas xianhensis]TDX21593.1 hypothetical protein DFO67_1353 [Halomonas xianhensis]